MNLCQAQKSNTFTLLHHFQTPPVLHLVQCYSMRCMALIQPSTMAHHYLAPQLLHTALSFVGHHLTETVYSENIMYKSLSGLEDGLRHRINVEIEKFRASVQEVMREQFASQQHPVYHSVPHSSQHHHTIKVMLLHVRQCISHRMLCFRKKKQRMLAYNHCKSMYV